MADSDLVAGVYEGSEVSRLVDQCQCQSFVTQPLSSTHFKCSLHLHTASLDRGQVHHTTVYQIDILHWEKVRGISFDI